MKATQVIGAALRFSRPHRVDSGEEPRLRDVYPGETGELNSEDKTRAEEVVTDALASLDLRSLKAGEAK